MKDKYNKVENHFFRFMVSGPSPEESNTNGNKKTSLLQLLPVFILIAIICYFVFK